VATAGPPLFYDPPLGSHREHLWNITLLTLCHIQASIM